jgi:hypothetical protein
MRPLKENMTFRVPEEHRLRSGPFKSSFETNGLNGAFFIPTRPGNPPLKVIASDGDGAPDGHPRWEHVSVSLPGRCPTWEEMCKVKALFWDDEDAVMELHPPRSTWVNNHSYCLHLWRPIGVPIPLPPQWMVGFPSLGTLTA